MVPKYYSLVTSPNGVSSRSATISNLKEWHFKVDFRMLWLLKATLPFKSISHTSYFNVVKISA